MKVLSHALLPFLFGLIGVAHATAQQSASAISTLAPYPVESVTSGLASIA